MSDDAAVKAIDEKVAELDGRLAGFEAGIAAARVRLSEIETEARDVVDERARLVAAREILTGDRPVPRAPRSKPKPPRDTAKGEFPCGGCDRVFDTEHGRNVHRRRVHRPTSSTAAPAKPPVEAKFDCPEPGCNFAGLTRADVARHRRDLDHYTEVDDDGNPIEDAA